MVSEHIFLKKQLALTKYHAKFCKEYRNILDGIGFNPLLVRKINDLPFLPVNLFKSIDFKSIKARDVHKVLTSSGTTGGALSKVFLDKENVLKQQKALGNVLTDAFGFGRVPMVIIDNKNLFKNRTSFSARGAAVLGFSLMGTERFFALNNDGSLDVEGLKSFVEGRKNVLFFGFTALVWNDFLSVLQQRNLVLNIPNVVLLHGGGWKKLTSEKVDNETFKFLSKKVLPNAKVVNYYGMIEQIGSVFLECTHGFLHTNHVNDIITRNPIGLTACEYGEEGVIQSFSLLPTSYCGHSVLSEDIGVVYGEHDCECGTRGKYFKVLGRVPKAEIRGCSDAGV